MNLVLVNILTIHIAPVPRKKEGRAARLAAMTETEGDASLNSAGVDETVESNVDESTDGKEKTAHHQPFDQNDERLEEESNLISFLAPSDV